MTVLQQVANAMADALVWMAKGLLRAYKFLLSPWLGSRCRFYPSCSQYGLEAFERFGLLAGLYLTLARLGRCHPWHEGGVDPVPEQFSPRWRRVACTGTCSGHCGAEPSDTAKSSQPARFRRTGLFPVSRH